MSPTGTILTFSLLVLVLFFFFFLIVWWIRSGQELTQGASPYTGRPLRLARDLSYTTKERVARFLRDKEMYDNPIFSFEKAAFCRDTGRLFPDSVNWLGRASVDWSFLRRRYPGHYLSWGSLSDVQQKAIRTQHSSLDLFQTETSSTRRSPSQIEPEYVFLRPGPLYVDLATGVLLGWQTVPGTDVEVLIVQKPLQSHAI